MGDYDEVLSQIENLRQVLNKLVLEKGISDLEVMQISKQLDEVLNKYHKMFKTR
ncbi:Spo0E like sporulation regulatory protein [Sporomusa ovata DSM 2662]|jgi:regulator of replication initiation timing|uniref:Spo0E like sporulation regulatory protein n=1 Tax=Sporomusa ovata TaxID=2378 RepID=A0A0U1L381_9FIRM|nr:MULTISPECIES: Spo0E family sporulation regulatory protein-aspartic acid phosphatase [Sporomusa]EQB25596.1 Spo0E like sporulation regulatory protein [Sporomusa ovata DSM 2662]TWH46218.1 Spo0E like sporulation regulatory protein [Sporomusa sp. KB1]CQR74152.1 hypothetical protein SpAn4DRAFT_0614 [Sporomusa ovata]